MTKKSNNSQSLHLRLQKDFLDEIDQFTEEFRFQSRTDALRFLIASGLKYQETARDLIEQKEDITKKS